MKRKALPLIGVLLITAAALAGGYWESRPAATTSPEDATVTNQISVEFERALALVQDAYAGTPDLELLTKYSIQSMLSQLDPHSAFFTKAEFDELQTEQRSRIYGIGVNIARRWDRVYIVAVIPGTPAFKAGLRYGDAIVAVDGRRVEDWSSEQVMHRVRGERGEPVDLTLERAGAPSPLSVRITRDEVKLPSVRNAFMIDDSTGYIALTGGFTSKTEEELNEALLSLKNKGMKHLILDLRGNPGGLLDQAIAVSRRFLPPGQKIVEVRGRSGGFPNRIFEVPPQNSFETMPMVVLVNRTSASASEIVAGALQDHDRALIVGESSFGKGLVQSVFNLKYGAGLTLTTAKYFTPTGRLIQRDYSKVSFYDYYYKRGESAAENDEGRGDAVHTDMGRAVYGGGGITPDIIVKSPESGPVRNKLFYAVFDFTRMLVAGQVPGLRQYRISETQHKSRVTQEDTNRFPVTEELVASFRSQSASKPHFHVGDAQFASNLGYIKSQMRREIITAAFGPEAGDQVYLSDDVQLRKAIESLDQAVLLADNARRAAATRQ